jgi:type 2 lantibiotic biosynthesis protein LanM
LKKPNFQSAAWYRALTLTERIASLRKTGASASNTSMTEQSRRRLEKWHTEFQAAARNDRKAATSSNFEQRLAMDGITGDELGALLGEAAEKVRDRMMDKPAWMEELEQAFSRHPDGRPLALPESGAGHEIGGFLEVVGPLIQTGRDRLRAAAGSIASAFPEVPFEPGTVESLLLPHLQSRLLLMLSRTMVLEMNLARWRGLLQGSSPAERFQSLIGRLCQRAFSLALLEEYPVLARQSAACIGQWVSFSIEFLGNLCADWRGIRRTLSADFEPGHLVKVLGGAGDVHRGGKSVLIAGFDSGFHVAYKPRSLALDIHFQELLAWMNVRVDHPFFRTLKILDRHSHGWVEFVDARSCQSVQEIECYYRRAGALLALLYVLEATDCHCENLIAAGEFPVLLDMEALFHPREPLGDPGRADQPAGDIIAHSVLETGLLPRWIWANAESEGIDLSGLGADSGQTSPQRVPLWEGVGTDEMRLVRRHITIPAEKNRPMLGGAAVNAASHVEEVVTGFAVLYRFLAEHREELLAEDGPLAAFAEDEVRVVPRPTQTYFLLLYESWHPDVLHDALDRDRLLDRLWVAAANHPFLVDLISAEREDLLQGDIPMFTSRPASRDLWTSSGRRITGFRDRSGMQSVRQRVQQLGDEDRDRQVSMIRASLGSLAHASHKLGCEPGCRMAGSHPVRNRKALHMQ